MLLLLLRGARPAGTGPSFVVASPAALPANHGTTSSPSAQYVLVTYAGTNTTWDGTTTFTPTAGPVAGYGPAVVLSPTSAQQYLLFHANLAFVPPGPTGTVTITCSDGQTAAVDVVAVGLAVSPAAGGIGAPVPLALTGTGSVWVSTNAGDPDLFAVSWGTITTTGRTSDTDATALFTPAGNGYVTITDLTTGATCAFLAGVVIDNRAAPGAANSTRTLAGIAGATRTLAGRADAARTLAGRLPN